MGNFGGEHPDTTCDIVRYHAIRYIGSRIDNRKRLHQMSDIVSRRYFSRYKSLVGSHSSAVAMRGVPPTTGLMCLSPTFLTFFLIRHASNQPLSFLGTSSPVSKDQPSHTPHCIFSYLPTILRWGLAREGSSSLSTTELDLTSRIEKKPNKRSGC